MSKAKSTAGKGQGWHKESTRHSQARLRGRAGGAYASTRIRKILKTHPEYKKLTFKQLQRRGVFLRYQSDSDKDGTTNIHDCRPLDKNRKDLGMTETQYQKYLNEQAEKETDLLPPEPKPKKHPIRDWVKEEKQLLEKKGEQARTRHLTELNSKLKNKIEREEDIDVKLLTDYELKQLAILEGKGTFGGDNQYERELKRRIDATNDLEADLILERKEAKKKALEKIKHPDKGGLFS